MDNNFTFFYIYNSFPYENKEELIYDFGSILTEDLLKDLPEYNPSEKVLDNLFRKLYEECLDR